MRHKHMYGPWTLHKSGDYAHLDDKEFVSSTRFPPFWVQSCDCGMENWYRARSRPLAKMKFREAFGSRVL